MRHKGHWASPLEVGDRAERRVDRELLVVGAETVAVGVGVGAVPARADAVAVEVLGAVGERERPFADDGGERGGGDVGGALADVLDVLAEVPLELLSGGQ